VLPLVEVIHGESSSQDVIDQGLNFIHKIRKLPLPVKSDFGFLVNRILVPYNEEAFILYYEERVPGAYIDQELVDFGMPMGPIELSDHVGLDITLSVAQKFKAAGLLKSDFPPELIELIEQGNVGRKSGKGIYQWRDNKAMKPTYDKHNLPPDIQDRIILRLLNECVLCLRKKIVTSEELIDAGAIFGVGFAPFRGGPMKYAHDRGINNIIKQLELFTARYGERFKPDAGWKLLAEE